MKYSFLMPYYRRSNQLYNTLVSFRHHYSKRADYELILIEDTKNDDDLHQVVDLFDNSISIYIFSGDDKPNPCTAFNKAAKKAHGQFLIITNPECFHKTNILDAMDVGFDTNPQAYFVCACKRIKNVSPKRIKDFSDLKYRDVQWYQHSKRSNNCFHFCTAIKASNYPGFDERYADGIAYDDIEFRDTLIKKKVKFIKNDKAVVLHQEHTKEAKNTNNRRFLTQKNKHLYYSEKEYEPDTAR